MPAITARDFVIARVSCLYGHERAGKNFVYQLWTAAQPRAGSSARPATRSGRRPPSANAADVIRDLVLGGHAALPRAGSEPMLRSEFALLAARELELDPGARAPAPTAELGLLAPRPMGAGLLRPRARSTGPCGRPARASRRCSPRARCGPRRARPSSCSAPCVIRVCCHLNEGSKGSRRYGPLIS